LIARFSLVWEPVRSAMSFLPPHFTNKMWIRSKWGSGVVFRVRSTLLVKSDADAMTRHDVASWFSLEQVCEKNILSNNQCVILESAIRDIYIIMRSKSKVNYCLPSKEIQRWTILRRFSSFYILRDSVVLLSAEIRIWKSHNRFEDRAANFSNVKMTGYTLVPCSQKHEIENYALFTFIGAIKRRTPQLACQLMSGMWMLIGSR